MAGAIVECGRKRSLFEQESEWGVASSPSPIAKRSRYYPPPPINGGAAAAAEADWAELLVKEMMGCASVDDAKSRVRGMLENFARSITVVAGDNAAAAAAAGRDERMDKLLQENAILKRAVAIQCQRQKEQEDRKQEVKELKDVVDKYREQVTTLRVNNHALSLYLKQADHQHPNSIPHQWHEVF